MLLAMAEPHQCDPELDEMLQRAREVIRRSHDLIAKSEELQRQSNRLKDENAQVNPTHILSS
jgi:hypothetical protein